MDIQGTKWRRKIAKNFNWLSRVHERYRQTTDGRAIAYCERECEFTFAKNKSEVGKTIQLRRGVHAKCTGSNVVRVAFCCMLSLYVILCRVLCAKIVGNAASSAEYFDTVITRLARSFFYSATATLC